MAGARIQLKRATAASWASNNPVLYSGEIGYETDTNKFKIGNGSTAYNSLPYFNGNLTGSSLNDLADVTIVSASNGDFLRWNGTAWINDAVNLSTDTVGNYMVDVVGGTGVTVSHTPGEGSTASVAIGQDVGTSASVSFGQLTVNGQTNIAGHVIPSTTETYDLGSASARFRDIYLSGTSINLGGAEITSDGTAITLSGGLNVDSLSNIDSVQFDTTASVAPAAGMLTWDSVEGTLNLGLTANKHIHLGEESVFRVRNTTGAAIQKGTAVYASGVEEDGTVEVFPYVADGTIREESFIGLATESITNGASGFAQTFGFVRGLDTRGTSATAISVGDETWAVGDLLYVHPTVAGKLTNVAPRHAVLVATLVIRNASTGVLLVRPSVGEHIQDLHDVLLTSPTDGQFLRYNSASTVWVNDTINLGTDTVGNYVSDVVAGTGVTVSHTPGEGSSASISIGQDVSTSASVTFGQVTISGDLTVNGTTTTLNTQDLLVEDNTIVLNANVTGNPSGTAGIEIERGNLTNVQLRWNETTDSWEITEDGTTYRNIAAGQDVETSSSVTFAAVTAPLVGNASTATALQTARTIELSGDVSGSASFDGTSNINISTTVNTASVSITELSGVNITNPEEFQTLEYNGTQWVNQYSSVVSYVRNAEATTLTTGTAVYLFGGTGDHASVKRADNNSDSTSSKTVGLVGANIASSQNGPVITRGYVDGLDLSVGYAPGDVLWLGENGAFTKTKPSAPDHLVFIGVVVRATNNGIVYVATQNGYELGELHDVKLNGIANGDFLKYNSASAVWVNDPINLGTDTVGNYMLDVSAGTGVTVSHTPGEGSTATISIPQSVATSASPTFAFLTLTGQPSETTHAVTKAYADSIAAGINWHESVELATAAVLPNTPTYDNGTGGIDATLTASASARLVVDGVNATTGNRILVKDQSNAVHNGIYDVTQQGSASAAWVLTRADDHDGHLDEVVRGDAVYVANGATNINQGFIINSLGTGTDNAHVIGTDSITFSQFTGAANIVAGTGIIKTGNILSIAQDVATTASVTFNTVSANLVGNASTATTLQNARTISLSGDVTGSVSFNGSANAEITATIAANSVALGTDTTGNYMSDLTAGTGVAITHTPGEGSNATIAIGQAVGTSSSVTFAHVSAPVTGNVTGNVTGDVTGNSGTATALQNARTISLGGDLSGSVSFNGTSDVTITAEVQPNSVALGTDTTGNYMSDLTQGTGVTITHTPGEGSNATIAIGQAVGTSSSVTFAAVTAPLVGNASTATALATSRAISLGGDLSGSASFDGSSDVTINATIAANSVALGTDTTGNYVSDVTAGTGVTVTHTPGEGSSPTIAIGQAVGTSASVQFAQITTTGNVTIGGDLTVNGTTTTVNTETINLADNIIVLNSNETSTPSQNAGIEIERGSATNVALRWNEANDKWELTTDGSNYDNIATEDYAASLAPSSLDDLSNVTVPSPSNGQVLTYSTASSAWIAQNGASAINALDDIGNVTAPSPSSGDFLKWNGSAWVNDAIDLGTDTTGNYVSGVVAGNLITVTHTPGEGSSASIAVTSGTAGQIIVANASGVPTWVTETGDITIDSSGVTAIGAGVIVNADISATAAIELGKLADVSTNAQTASYTLVLADKNRIVEMSVGSANNLTVPLNSSVPFPVGSQINILQTGTGQTTIVATGGVTINATPGLKMRAQWSYATLIKRAENTWVLVGDISA